MRGGLCSQILAASATDVGRRALRGELRRGEADELIQTIDAETSSLLIAAYEDAWATQCMTGWDVGVVAEGGEGNREPHPFTAN